MQLIFLIIIIIILCTEYNCLYIHLGTFIYLFSGFGAVYLISFALFVPRAGKSFADKWPL